MTPEKLCLQYNGFANNLKAAFCELREDKNLLDVTLVCDDEQIQVHKVVLSASSPFFRRVFKRNPHPHPLLYLKGVKMSSLQSVLDFMYYGKVYVIQEELQLFLKVAEDLDILTQNEEQSTDNNDHHPTQNKSFSKSSSLSKPTTVSDILPPPEKTPPLSKYFDNEEVVLHVKKELQTYQAVLEVNDNIVEQDHIEQYEGDEGQEDCGEYVEEEGKYEAGTMEMDDSKLWSEDQDEVKIEDKEQNLKNYVEKHMKSPRKQCKFCQKQFKNSNSLKNHVSNYHREERKKQQ